MSSADARDQIHSAHGDLRVLLGPPSEFARFLEQSSTTLIDLENDARQRKKSEKRPRLEARPDRPAGATSARGGQRAHPRALALRNTHSSGSSQSEAETNPNVDPYRYAICQEIEAAKETILQGTRERKDLLDNQQQLNQSSDYFMKRLAAIVRIIEEAEGRLRKLEKDQRLLRCAAPSRKRPGLDRERKYCIQIKEALRRNRDPVECRRILYEDLRPLVGHLDDPGKAEMIRQYVQAIKEQDQLIEEQMRAPRGNTPKPTASPGDSPADSKELRRPAARRAVGGVPEGTLKAVIEGTPKGTPKGTIGGSGGSAFEGTPRGAIGGASGNAFEDTPRGVAGGAFSDVPRYGPRDAPGGDNRGAGERAAPRGGAARGDSPQTGRQGHTTQPAHHQARHTEQRAREPRSDIFGGGGSQGYFTQLAYQSGHTEQRAREPRSVAGGGDGQGHTTQPAHRQARHTEQRARKPRSVAGGGDGQGHTTQPAHHQARHTEQRAREPRSVSGGGGGGQVQIPLFPMEQPQLIASDDAATGSSSPENDDSSEEFTLRRGRSTRKETTEAKVIVMEHLRRKVPVAKVCELTGAVSATVYRWKREAKARGEDL
jgi:hypothetical protein